MASERDPSDTATEPIDRKYSKAKMDTALVGKYEGDMQNGRYHGRGKITYGENYYEGTFFDGQMHGEGKMTVKGEYNTPQQHNADMHILMTQ